MGEGSDAEITRLVIVGDVHGDWDGADEAAVAFLRPHATLFVGDFGEEDVPLVERIAAFAHRQQPGTVAVQLGNHDAWNCLTARGRDTFKQRDPLEAKSVTPGGCVSGGVRRQLEALREVHVGYSAMPLPARPVGIIGARPFSKGGKGWNDVRPFYSELYGVESLDASARRITSALVAQPSDCALIVLAHNGRTGLGSGRRDICGVDWQPTAGDHGDPDLARALDDARAQGRTAAAVVFGHMHHRCRGDMAWRKRLAVTPDGTLHLNAAVVPRHKVVPCAGGIGGTVLARHFVVLELRRGVAIQARDVWVTADTEPNGSDTHGSVTCAILEERRLLRTKGVDPLVREVYDVQLERWRQV